MKKITSFLAVVALATLSCNKSSNNNNNSSSCAGGPVCTYTLAAGETAGVTVSSIRGTHTLVYDSIVAGGPWRYRYL